MLQHSTSRRSLGLVSAAVSVLCMSVTLGAVAQAPQPEVRITVFADQYLLAGRLIDDLDILEHAVASIHPRAVRLAACGTGTDRAQMAAAHRFRRLHLELLLRSLDSPDCAPALALQLAPASHRLGQRPFGIDDQAVDRWRHDLMP